MPVKFVKLKAKDPLVKVYDQAVASADECHHVYSAGRCKYCQRHEEDKPLDIGKTIHPSQVLEVNGTEVILPFKPQFPKTTADPSPLILALTQDIPEIPPWEPQEGYTILEALKDFADKRFPPACTRLLLISKSDGSAYTVRSYSLTDGRALLEGPTKALLKPVITQREVPLYNPFWQ